MNEANVPKVVVVGSGFAGLESAFYLRKRLGRRVHLTLVSESDSFQFTPNNVYVPFGKPPEAFSFPLRPVFDKRHIRFVQARAEALDPLRKKLRAAGKDVAYDYLLLATGAATRPDEIPGLDKNAITIWTAEDMLRLRGAFASVLDRANKGQQSRVLFLVPPNNKCPSPLYELSMMLDTWMQRNRERHHVDIIYATHEKSYLQPFGPRLNDYVANEFERRGIVGRKEAIVDRVEAGRAVFRDGSSENFDLLVSFPPSVASTRFEGLPADDRGFVLADFRTRQAKSQPDVYAIGDAGDFPVKQALLAVSEADTAAEHVAERILGESPVAAFDPVSMFILEEFDKATFVQVPLRVTDNPDWPVTVRESEPEQYKVSTGPIWRIAKRTLGVAVSQRFSAGQPFHAGASWAMMEAGIKVLSGVFGEYSGGPHTWG
jgi:NADH dehydrogenase FAD-containing subunit